MHEHDHRSLGNRLDLFHQQEDAPGMVFWHPRGWVLYRLIEDHIRKRMREAGYREVRSPQILAQSIFRRSGHLEKAADTMFHFVQDDGRAWAVKPVSCPGHIQIFNQRLRSFRDLPMRYCEFGCVHRDEPSGALHGLMRARQFTQDDAHVFCTADQVEAEVRHFCRLQQQIYADFGFDRFEVRFSTRPEQRHGDDALWDKAEGALEAAARAAGLDPILQPGEGAFYGPKLEFHLQDRLGRWWQCGTVQLDAVLPERMGAAYRDEQNGRAVPLILHHAVLGSLERFIGILIEHHAGNLPPWLAPVQAQVFSITDAQADYVRQVTQTLVDKGFRVHADLRNEKVGYKIREHTLQKVPYLLVVGDREKESGSVSVRTRSGEDLGSMPLASFIERLETETRR